MNNLLKALFILLVCGGVGFGIWNYFQKANQGKPVFFHDTELKLITGGTTSVDASKGKVTIVACFQTWCSDCIKEIPILAEVKQTLGSDQIEILFVSDEPFDKLVRFSGMYPEGMQFTHAPFKFKESGIKVYPTTYLLNKEGEIVLEKFEGWAWNNAETMELMRELVNQ